MDLEVFAAGLGATYRQVPVAPLKRKSPPKITGGGIELSEAHLDEIYSNLFNIRINNAHFMGYDCFGVVENIPHKAACWASAWSKGLNRKSSTPNKIHISVIHLLKVMHAMYSKKNYSKETPADGIAFPLLKQEIGANLTKENVKLAVDMFYQYFELLFTQLDVKFEIGLVNVRTEEKDRGLCFEISIFKDQGVFGKMKMDPSNRTLIAPYLFHGVWQIIATYHRMLTEFFPFDIADVIIANIHRKDKWIKEVDIIRLMHYLLRTGGGDNMTHDLLGGHGFSTMTKPKKVSEINWLTCEDNVALAKDCTLLVYGTRPIYNGPERVEVLRLFKEEQAMLKKECPLLKLKNGDKIAINKFVKYIS